MDPSKPFKPVYRNAEPVWSEGKIIGEIYPCSLRKDTEEWGYLVYSNEEGGEGYRNTTEALKSVYASHAEYLSELRYKLKKIQAELKDWV